MSVGDNPVQQSIDDWEPVGARDGSEFISDVVRVPGYWPVREQCTRLTALGFCENAHIQLGSESSCKRRDCPEHWYLWRREAVENLVARLAAYRYAQDGRDKRLLHAVASLPQDQRWTLERFWSMRRDGYDLAGEHGCAGGAFVPHAYVPTDAARAAFASAVEKGYWDAEKGLWRFVRDCWDDWEGLRSDLEVRPHGHMLASWANLDGESLEEELPEGWVLHNVRSLAPLFVYPDEVDPYWMLDENYSIEKTREEVVTEGFEDMARLAMYLLSHGAVQPGGAEGLKTRNTVTYFGSVHPNAFDPEEEIGEAAWERIKRLAAESVGQSYEEESGEGSEQERTCSREECEAAVQPLGELGEYLSDVHEYEGWFDSLPYDQQCEIWGLWLSMGDRPPPGQETEQPGADESKHHLPPGGFGRSPDVSDEVATSSDQLLEWYRRFGRARLHRKPGYSAPGADA